ncbi:YggN family protein [Shewanella intestini]|uniref:YggN family protein n=1 Tax=Shewanella intestini TaxID=2017544 RepID=A0ABS5I4D6_9GAMM|nr:MULTISPECIES: YggN family protein [Shewanella]MBR9728230.1 YggN family protein [Shewanella intestini]MRG35695.1 DUF2884 family protein [Shewanella sp. XMDDZSB0408]
MTKQNWAALVATTGLVLTSVFAAPAMAKLSLNDEQCNVSLNYDITVEPKQVKISEAGKEQYRIELGKLYVNNKQVNLTAKQQALVNDYADAMSQQIPEVIELIGDVVELATHSVSLALTPLLGDATGSQIDKLMAGINQRIDKAAYQQGDRFFLGATESTMGKAFNDEFAKEIEQVMSDSIGTIMMKLGGELLSSQGGSFEQKMEAFGQKMENVGQDIEQQVAAQSQDIEARTDKACHDFESLLVMEQNLRTEIPQLAPYVLTTQNPHHAISE